MQGNKECEWPMPAMSQGSRGKKMGGKIQAGLHVRPEKQNSEHNTNQENRSELRTVAHTFNPRQMDL